MFKSKWFSRSIVYLAMAGLAMGCSGSEDSSTSSGSTTESLVISGSLGSGGSQKLLAKSFQSLSAASIDVSDLEVYGLAFSDPPEVQTVNLNASGAFELEFSGDAAGSPISLIFRYNDASARAGEQVGVVKFVDDDEKDIDGNSSSSSSLALSGNVSLGSLSIDENGDVSVPVTQISSNIAKEEVESSEAFDFSGNWIFKKFDKALPEGYSHVCAASDNDCDGPAANMPIHLKRIVGKKFAANTSCRNAADDESFDADSDTCGGSTQSEDKYMIQVWKSADAAATCGNRLGFKNEAAKAYARIDFSDSGVTEGEFTWTAGYADGWKDTTARAIHDLNNCGPATVTADDSSQLHGWKCTDSSGNYEIGLNGGCYDGSGNPVHVTDWGSISPDSCNSSAADGLTNFEENTCVYTSTDPDGSGSLTAMDFECKHVYGRFDSDGSLDDVGDGGTFDWNSVANIYDGESSQGAGDGDLCSSVTPSTDEEKIAQLRCYAEHLWKNGDLEDDDTKCIRRVDTNWATDDPDEFILKENGPPRAATLFVLAKFEYDSAISGFFEDEDVYHRGIQTGDNWTNCKVKDRFRMSVKKRSSTALVAEFVQEMILLDSDKEACVADSESDDGELQVGVSKSIMLLKK